MEPAGAETSALRGAAHADRSPVARATIVLLLGVIAGTALWNAAVHDPRIAYDGPHHLRYVTTLAEGRLPGLRDTEQHYVPPVPYVLPAAAIATLGWDPLQAARAALLVQAGMAIGLALIVLALCERLRPGDDLAKIVALTLLGTPATFYRTFAMMRGEPYLAFFGAVSTLLVFGVLARERFGLRSALALGATWSVLVLSRHWGLIVVGATAGTLLVVGLRRRRSAPGLLPTLAVALAVVLPPAAWFYSDAAERPQHAFDGKLRVARADASRLESAGIGWPRVLQHPGRPAFHDQPLAILYADWWGDYHGYFLYRGDHRVGGRVCLAGSALEEYQRRGLPGVDANYASIGPYLGRVNLAGLLPTGVLAVGLVLGAGALLRTTGGRSPGPRGEMRALLAAIVLATLAGHVALLTMIGLGGPGRDAVKASYDLQLLPAAALLGADAVARLRRRAPRSAMAIVVALLVVMAHGHGAAITRWPVPQTCLVRGWDPPTPASQRD